jgi:hypothetical protein
MPIATTAAILLAAGAGATAGASIYGAKKQAGAAREAAQIQGRAAEQQLAFERENEARRRAEYDRAEEQARAQWMAEQARQAPYEEAANAVLRRWSGQLGYPAPTTTPMPTGTRQDLGRPWATPPPPSAPAAMPGRRLTLGDLAQARRPQPDQQTASGPMTPPLTAPPVLPYGPTLGTLAQPRRRRV